MSIPLPCAIDRFPPPFFIPRPALRSQLLLPLDLLSCYKRISHVHTLDFNKIRLIECSYYLGVKDTDLGRIKLAIPFNRFGEQITWLFGSYIESFD